MIETFFFKLSHQQEIEELRTKLSDISRQKQEIDHAMRNGTTQPNAQPSAPQTQVSTTSNNSDSDSQPSSPSLTRSTLNSFSDSLKDGDATSLRAQHIRAFLPNNQRTMVSYYTILFLFYGVKYFLFQKSSIFDKIQALSTTDLSFFRFFFFRSNLKSVRRFAMHCTRQCLEDP